MKRKKISKKKNVVDIKKKKITSLKKKISSLFSKKKNKKTIYLKQKNLSSGTALVATTAVIFCPACSVLLAGIISSMGLVAIIPFWQPAVVVLLLLALAGFIMNYKTHHNPKPLYLLVIGDALLYSGRYIVGYDPIWIVGSVLILAAVILNFRACKAAPCPVKKSRFKFKIGSDIYKYISLLLAGIIIGYLVSQSSLFGISTPGRIITPSKSSLQGIERGIDNAGNHYIGASDSPVTVVEFSDFQCPFCGRFFSQTFPQLRDNYVRSGKVKFVYRHFPLINIHAQATLMAEASECAGDQNKFWEYHDTIFLNFELWNNNPKANDIALEMADELGLNKKEFSACLASGKKREKVIIDLQTGSKKGVRATPTFYLNGTKLEGAQPYFVFSSAIDKELTK